MADQRNRESIDPEMLKNLELLINLDVLESEDDWNEIEKLDELQDQKEDERFSDES